LTSTVVPFSVPFALTSSESFPLWLGSALSRLTRSPPFPEPYTPTSSHLDPALKSSLPPLTPPSDSSTSPPPPRFAPSPSTPTTSEPPLSSLPLPPSSFREATTVPCGCGMHEYLPPKVEDRCGWAVMASPSRMSLSVNRARWPSRPEGPSCACGTCSALAPVGVAWDRRRWMRRSTRGRSTASRRSATIRRPSRACVGLRRRMARRGC
jgi:hypothetical protein